MNNIEELIAQLEAALSTANEGTLAPVILEIANERLRQISVEGWTPEHDDQHSSGELAGAAGCYAKHVNARQWCFKNNPDDYQCEPEPSGWPWEPEWWKPKNPRSDLIRAAALIVAELERLDRAAGFTVKEDATPIVIVPAPAGVIMRPQSENPLERCAAGRDGECHHKDCPQLRDNEPMATGRHCPIDNWDDE